MINFHEELESKTEGNFIKFKSLRREGEGKTD